MPITFAPYRETPFRRCDRSWPPGGPWPDDPPPMALEGEGDAGVALARNLEDALCAELRKRGCQVMEYPPGGEGESLLRISRPLSMHNGIPLDGGVGLYLVGLRGVLAYGATAVAQMIMEHLIGKHVGPYDDPYDAIDPKKRKEDPQ